MRTGLTESKYQCGQLLCLPFAFRCIQGSFCCLFVLMPSETFQPQPRCHEIHKCVLGDRKILNFVIVSDITLDYIEYILDYSYSIHLGTESVLVNDLLLSFSPYKSTPTAPALFQTHCTGKKLKVWRVCLSEFSWCFRWLLIL